MAMRAYDLHVTVPSLKAAQAIIARYRGATIQTQEQARAAAKLALGAPWGSIAVAGGDAMITKDFRYLRVAAPENIRGRAVHGQGWTLKLATGSAIVADPHKPASYIVTSSH